MEKKTPLALMLSYLWANNEKRLKLYLGFALLALVVAKILTACVPIIYKIIIDSFRFGIGDAMAVPVLLIVGYGSVRIVAAILDDVRDTVFMRISQRATRRIALRVFDQLHQLGLRFHLDKQTGLLSTAIERGTKGISTLLSRVVFMFVPALIEIALVSTILWYLYNGWFALVAVVTVSCYIAFTIAIVRWRTQYRKRLNEATGEASSKSVDSLLNYETVKYFNNESFEASSYDKALGRYEQAALRDQLSFTVLSIGQTTIISFGLIAMMLLAGNGVASKSMTIGDFVLVNTYLLQIYLPLNFFGMMYRDVKQAMSDMEYMVSLLSLEREIEDAPDAAALKIINGEVCFQNLSFGYEPNRLILDDISFAIPAGGTVAVVGPSGSGKSTLARLLYRFYDPTSGHISIDGQKLTSLTQASVRDAIGIVPQDTVLFNRSIGYNIHYGRPEAPFPDVIAAAKMAHINEFIERLPEGYETPVGERGLKLSGGEKQRVAIARVVLKDPKLLVFDEATSALDTHTEREIQANLKEVTRGRTTLVIAHRLSTIADADEILVLQRGRIAERGSHKELLEHAGIYASMWHQQNSTSPQQ